MYKQVIHHGIEQQVIKRLSDNVFIPFDDANTDYQEYLKWLGEGNTPLPPDQQGASNGNQ